MDEGLDAAAALADPVRRTLYRFVVDATEPVGRDEAAAAAGIGRSLAGYHLDQLVEDGLLAGELRAAQRSARDQAPGGRPSCTGERTSKSRCSCRRATTPW